MEDESDSEEFEITASEVVEKLEEVNIAFEFGKNNVLQYFHSSFWH